MNIQKDNGEKSFYLVLEAIIKHQRFTLRISELDSFLERLEQKKSVSSEERKILLDLANQLSPQGSWIIDRFHGNEKLAVRP